MKRPLHLFLLLLVGTTAFSQRGNNWVFGANAWINFSTAPPTSGQSAMYQQEGSSSISDIDGNLLFYSDGVQVWNAQHQVMPNGTGLFGHFSSTQSSMIVPFPEDTKRYYLFTMDVIGGPNGLSYSVVNMDLDNGKGDIESKNHFLIGPSSEKVTSVNHCNGKDVWVLTAVTGSDKFYAYLVTATGVNPPIVSTVGVPLPYFSIGYLKFSPDGTRVAAANFGIGLDLFDFDASTGIITNRKRILSGANQQMYGVEFSPNSKMMYVANTVKMGAASRYDLSQYSKLEETEAVIAATRFELDNDFLPSAPSSLALFNALQLGPDGRVHMSTLFYNLYVVNKPDRLGAACEYSRNGIQLVQPTRTIYGLPDFNQSYFKGSFSYKVSCTNNDVEFYFTKQGRASGVKWDFGDPASGLTNNSSTLDSPVHSFTAPGIYEVKVISFLGCRNDTLKKMVHVGPLKVNIGPDKDFCGNDPYTLTAQVQQGIANSYLWQDNSTNPQLTANTSGLYWVEIKNTESGCTARDSMNLRFTDYPTVFLGNDTTICERSNYLLDAGNPGANYTWQDNTHNQTLLVRKPGKYSVSVDNNGCIGTDTITIGMKYIPRMYLGNDTAICDGMTLQLKPFLSRAQDVSFNWSTGSMDTAISVTEPGHYSLTVSNTCGTAADEVIVNKGVCRLYVPTGFTPNNDGKNDIFKPGYGENVTNFKMEIYNRWGERTFESNQIYKGWDGTLKGSQQPAGVYAWYIRYNIFNDPTEYSMKGTLMLIR